MENPENKTLIVLSLLFWLQLTIVAILGVKLLWNNLSIRQEIKQKVITPAMLKGKI